MDERLKTRKILAVNIHLRQAVAKRKPEILQGYITNSQFDQLPAGLIAQFVCNIPLRDCRLSFRNYLSCVLTARIFLVFK